VRIARLYDAMSASCWRWCCCSVRSGMASRYPINNCENRCPFRGTVCKIVNADNLEYKKLNA